MKIVVKSDRGKKRLLNEDSAGYFYNHENIPFIIVCDGIGGHNAGEVASKLAVTQIGEHWQETSIHTISEAQQWLASQIQHVNALIYQQAAKDESMSGMGTTLVAGFVLQGRLIIANIGDSRCYLYRDFELIQLTEDHSLVNELIKNGEITELEALHHPRRNYVTRSLGVETSVKPDFIEIELLASDKILLCSDGLSGMLHDFQIAECITTHKSITSLVDDLIDQANLAGGKDNITVIVVDDVFHQKGEG